MSAKVLVSTPDLRPSLLSVLQGLSQTGLLQRVVTTLPLDARQIGWISGLPFFGPRIDSALKRRQLPAFLQGRTDAIWLGELIRLIAARTTGPVTTHMVWQWAERRFDRMVAKRYGGRFDLIYGVEHGSAATFAAQKISGGACVLRQVNAHGHCINAMLRREAGKFPEHVTAYHRLLMSNEAAISARKTEEYRLADLIVANSEYVRHSFIANGIAPDKVVAVPTGCPPVEQVRARSGQDSTPVRFLYAGTISLRKGFLYLLDAWRQLEPGASAELWIAGNPELNILPELARTPGVRYLGVLSKPALQEIYRQSDVLVLPTLCEGLAHVVLEGLSFGLPIITTEASGAGDLIIHGENGFISPEGDASALAAAIEYALDHRGDLLRMGARSAERAENWTVAQSNAEHLRVLQTFLAHR